VSAQVKRLLDRAVVALSGWRFVCQSTSATVASEGPQIECERAARMVPKSN